MFKLIRLSVYALVGYAVYQFVSDVVQASEQQSSRRGNRGGNGGGEGKPTQRRRNIAKTESTEDSDGGSTRHRVGRGVV
jgi:hypothetical protein